MRGLTAEIVVPAVIMVAAAIAIVIITSLDFIQERKKRREAEEGMIWWAGLFISLATKVITEQGYKIDVEPDGKITLTKKEEKYRSGEPQQTGQAPNKTVNGSLADWTYRTRSFNDAECIRKRGW